jgi:hypothetical protein
MDDVTQESTEGSPEPQRMPYTTPTLHRFGLLADITRRVAMTSTLRDGGGGSKTKTR